MDSKKHIAIFSSLNYHYEMFGYIINFCAVNNYHLTIFTDNLNSDNGWLNYYKNVVFTKFDFEFKHYNYFQQEKYLFDLIFLTSNTDKYYFEYFNTDFLKNNTICITHCKEYLYEVKNPDSYKTIYVRPFTIDSMEEWFLPFYNIENSVNRKIIAKQLSENNFVNIAIIGTCGEHDKFDYLVYYNYNVNFINRIKCNKKIRLHVIARNVTSYQLFGLNPSIQLHTYENIQTEHMFDILKKCNYILTDANCYYQTTYEINRLCDINKHINGENVGNSAPEDYYYKYERRQMSGAIPMAFSLCIPLIISSQTNQYYKLKNVIEFDKTTDDEIILTEIQPELIESERNETFGKFSFYVEKYMKEIISNKKYKMMHKINYNIVYINIDERTDRRWRFEKHMNEYDLTFERYSAIKDSFGPLGCAKSHLNVLKNARSNGYENIIIMEDDFAFNLPPKIVDEKLKLIFDNDLVFDVFHLSFRWRLYNDSEEYSYLKKLNFCHYCSCYIVNKQCYDEIIEWWEKSLVLLEHTKKTSLYSCDISYTPLLRKKKWYSFHEPIGLQLSGYSNIENRYINHYKEDIIEHPCPELDPTTILFNSNQYIDFFNF
jgi:glycosyl transferase family 25